VFLQKWSKSTEQLIVWGSDDVLKAWGQFKTMAAGRKDQSNPVRALLPFETLLLAVRSGLGHSNTNLKPGDLLRLFVNDMPDQV
jgi:hypothetical protein